MQLELKDIGKQYSRQWLFRHVDFRLESGQSLAITGRNGSGKSTLMQIVYGLIQASEGEVLVNGNANFESSKYFAITSPGMELPMEFSISELHQLYLNLKKTSTNFDAFLAFSEFSSSQANKPIKYFSSGMLQRLKTAFCIQSNAGILLLDEPLTNMDVYGEKWYKNCLGLIQDRICIIAGNHPVEYEWANSTLQLI